MKILMLESGHLDETAKGGLYHYANLFSEDEKNDVFLISSPISLFHFLKTKSFKNNISRFKIWFFGGKRYKKNLFAYIPFVAFPIYNKFIFKSSYVIENSLRFSYPNINKILANLNFKEVDVLLLSHILLHQIFDIVSAKIKIYRITDDISRFPAIPDRIKEVENKIILSADIVFTTSLNLFERIKKIKQENLYYIPNGVDFDFFSKSSNLLPDEYKNIPEPRIIYVGVIDSWFDVDLVYFLAKELSNFSYVLIGPARINLSKLQKCKNVYLLGEKNYTDIPRYLKNSSVGIIPFKNTELIQSVSPIKMYEYFSVGLPVVALGWEELKKIGSPAFLTNTYQEFKDSVKKALNITDKNIFIEYAKNNSWRKRFEEIEKIITEIFH